LVWPHSFSPIYLSASKPGYGPALGLAELRRVAVALPVPVIALGGITAATAAVMGAVMRADEPAAVVQALLQALRPWLRWMFLSVTSRQMETLHRQ